MEVVRGLRRREARWINRYSSGHDILLVGEGDFSFSSCLALAFGSAKNIVATSLDSYDALIKKYKNAKANLEYLEALGASLLHGVDATEMKIRPDLRWKKFHRIIFNFPRAGFYGKEDNPVLISMHRDLVHGFLENASRMLRQHDGEIHVNHKITAPFDRWRIEDLAPECSLLFVGQDDFRIEDYPGYRNKRGSGWESDEPFRLGECKTFRFKLCPTAENIVQIPADIQQQPVLPFANQPPPVSSLTFHEDGLRLQPKHSSRYHRICAGYPNHVEQMHWSRDIPGCGAGQTLSGELYHQSDLRSQRHREMVLRFGQQE